MINVEAAWHQARAQSKARDNIEKLRRECRLRYAEAKEAREPTMKDVTPKKEIKLIGEKKTD